MSNRSDMGRGLPPQRKAIYYLGVTFLVMGVVVFLSAFLVFQPPANSGAGAQPAQDNTIRIVASLSFIVLGGILMRIASTGAVGLDRLPDPRQARQQDAWKRAAGQDLLEGDELDRALRKEDGSKLPDDVTMDMLEQLRAEGRITEEEYRNRRDNLLSSSV